MKDRVDEQGLEETVELTPSTPSTTTERLIGAAAVDRQRALRDEEHVNDVLRLRRLVSLALYLWPTFSALDWIVVTYIEPGDIRFYFTVRAIALVPIVIVVWRINAAPIPSRRLFTMLDLAGFTVASIGITLMCLEYRGITSPYFAGVILVLAARGAGLVAPWQRGALLIGAPALAFPAVLLTAALRSPAVAAQLGDPEAVATFLQSNIFIAATAVLLVVGGHARWALRRQVFEARSIGRYRLKHRIGKGGMGEVWVAYHQSLKRDVALKILRPRHAGIERELDVARFEREVAATTLLTHPNTVRVFDYGVTEDGVWYYAMELLSGCDLAALVSRDGPLPPEQALHFGLQAAKALAEAHARGIVHRDIKPANLFVAVLGGETDCIKVLDFGIAKLRDGSERPTLTRDGWAGGTPAYISPEAASGLETDSRSDVYGLGAVMYFALAGRPPFVDRNPAALLHAHAYDIPQPPSAHRGAPVPADFEVVIMRCLEKEPARRYASAIELADALSGCAGAGAWTPTFDARPAQPDSGARGQSDAEENTRLERPANRR